MKKIFYSLAAVALVAATVTSCSDDNDNVPTPTAVTIENDTITFEGTKWDKLVEPTEYGGTMTYAITDEAKAYSWKDDSTSLGSTFQKGYFYTYDANWNSTAHEGWDFTNGGYVISNHSCDITKGTYLKQLSLVTGTAPHSGSNFLVYYNGETEKMTFTDNKARTIKGLWVNNTAYVQNVLKNGNEYCQKATANSSFTVKFTALDKDGKATVNMVSQSLQDGTKTLTDWTYVDLSTLGPVYGIAISFSASDDLCGKWGINVPLYVAIDDIVVKKLVPVTIYK